MQITLVNRFHNTEVNIRVAAQKDGEEFFISRATQRRMTKALCPHGGRSCQCAPMNQAIGKYDYDVVDEKNNGDILARLVEKYKPQY
jgi:hypothetical protein